MERNVKKDIEEYRRRYYGTSSTNGKFNQNDFYQIVEIGGSKLDIIFNALEAGFMVGYRLAKREDRKRAKQAV